MTLIDSLGVESSISAFQLLRMEKLSRILSHAVTVSAASTGFSASLIFSSRYQAQSTIKTTTANIALERHSLVFHSSFGHRFLPRQPHTPLREEVVAKFKLFYQQNVAFHLEDVLSVEYPRVQVFLGQVVYFRVGTGFGQAQADV